MQTLDAIKTRRTIRKFTEDPVSHEVIEKIVEASAYAPSWKNTQTARYIIIEETALKNKIAKEAVMGFEWNTGIILGAPVLVVLASVPGKSGYEKNGGIIELVYIVLQSVVKPGITGFFKIDLHIKCYIYLS